MSLFRQFLFAALSLNLILFSGCQHLIIHTDRIVRSNTDLPEIVGIVAGFGTTFAAFPDFLAMMRRRSSEGMSPRMGAIMGVFQILWIYYGLLIASRPVIIWNVIAVFINFLTVGAYAYFLRKERCPAEDSRRSPRQVQG